MGVERLLTQTVEILPFLEGAVDDYNDPAPGYGSAVEVQAYLERRDERADAEDNRDRETAVSTWLLVVPASAALTYRDRIVYAGNTYEVHGTVNDVWNPRLRRVSHKEADLRLVEDREEVGS